MMIIIINAVIMFNLLKAVIYSYLQEEVILTNF